ncbi:unnamed protein product, partial [Mesorhabditis belari]|uniref:Uncharacterized protein n=1 Tax=Mesorhabditis belari TaxID=2138241 RepID=A0AAF3FQI0_9BILA
MKTVLLLAVVVTIASGFLPGGQIRLRDEDISLIADMSRKLPGMLAPPKPNEDAIIVTSCIDTNWNACQYNFNAALGIDPTLTWRQADKLADALNKVLATNVTQVVSVCNDNTRFYQCLGTSYYDCMDLYRLIRLKNADFNEAFEYVQIYLQLQFMCNAGFEEVMKDYYCFTSLATTNSVLACAQTFNQTAQQPGQLCNAVDQADQCLNAAYQSGCTTAEAGWWGCEEFRVAFDPTCYGLRCNVNHG